MTRSVLITALLVAGLSPAPASGETALDAAVRRAAERRGDAERGESGWVRMGGRWVRPAARLAWGDLVSVEVKRGGAASVSAVFAPETEGLFADGREVLVEVAGRPFLIDARGRAWDAGRVGPTQVLTLRPAGTDTDAAGAGGATILGLTIRPGVTTVEAVVTPPDRPAARVTVRVMAAGLTATVAPADAAGRPSREDARAGPVGAGAEPDLVPLAGDDALDLLVRHPADGRRYVAPVLAALNDGVDPLAPRAGDLSRAFGPVASPSPDLSAVAALLPGLGHPDPAVRRSAEASLASLGPAGVRGAAGLLADPSARIAPDARVRLSARVAAACLYPLGAGGVTDGAALRADPHFLLDALSAPDPADRRAAAGLLAGLGVGEALALTPGEVLAWHERIRGGGD